MKYFALLLVFLAQNSAIGRIVNSKYLNVPIDASLIRLNEQNCSAFERLDTGHRLEIGVFEIEGAKEVKVMVEEHSTLNGKSCPEKFNFLKTRLAEIQKTYGQHAKVILSASNGLDSEGKPLPGDQWIELNVAPGQAKLTGKNDPRTPRASVQTLPSTEPVEHGAEVK